MHALVANLKGAFSFCLSKILSLVPTSIFVEAIFRHGEEIYLREWGDGYQPRVSKS
jgi:hypothetical protein